MTTATLRWTALLLFLAAAPAAVAQTLGDEFILFVDGTNVLVPNVDAGATVVDPFDATNRVARFSAGSWAETGFAWERSTGVDATQSVGAVYGESDTLYFRLLSDVANATAGGVSIMISDATSDTGAPRADVEAGTVEADYLMRLVWTIPAELHDGQWHDLAIPLPPATWAALEEARAAELLMDGAENWAYTGAWSTGGFGIGGVGGFDPPTSDPLWEEFGWDQLYRIGPFWDNANGGGPIYLDDVYIGGPGTDTSGATEAAAAMSGVTFAADGAVNKLTWAAIDGAGGYNVYASLSPITNVEADGVTLLERIALGEPNEFVHRYESPHPSLGAPQIYYAVTTLSLFGVENTDVSSSAGDVVNASITQKPYIRQLTTAEADLLFDAVSNGVVTDEAFPDEQPVFVFDSSHRTVTEGEVIPTDEDVSARVKIGYTELQEWFVYGEIIDDTVVLAPEFETGTNTYLYDSIELEIGHYDVRTIEDGGLLLGSPHTNMERGAEPDYQVRIAGRQNGAGDVIGASTWIGFSLNEDFADATVVEKTDTGWRFLTLIPMDQIQNTAEGDVLLPVPGSTELQLIPFTLSINDADGTGQRETQVVYSVKPNVTNQWYQTPNQWETVAIAGRDLPNTVAVEDGTARDGFSLAQSAPNPTSDVASVSFSLGAPARATVEVFNMLGQRVLTVVDRELGTGPHTVAVSTAGLAPGVYVYRLSAGSYAATRRMTVIR